MASPREKSSQSLNSLQALRDEKPESPENRFSGVKQNRRPVSIHRTYSAKPAHVVRQWYLIDASEAPLGRIATQVAKLLTGKDKPQFTKHIDCGDFVVVINAERLVATGSKLEDKYYYRYSGFPSGLSSRSLGEQLEHDATLPIRHAVRGMLPVNKLRDDRLKRLKVFRGPEHTHEAQNPKQLSVKHVGLASKATQPAQERA